MPRSANANGDPVAQGEVDGRDHCRHLALPAQEDGLGTEGERLLAGIAEQESQRNQAEFARQTAIVKAQYKAEVDKAQAQAAQSGPLAEAQSQREVLEMRTELAEVPMVAVLVNVPLTQRQLSLMRRWEPV